MSSRVEEAVNAERTSKHYALNYYMEEAEVDPLFKFDIGFLDNIFRQKGKLLDATMGRGRHLIHFARRGFEVHGNDYNKNMVDSVREDMKKLNLKAKLYNYDIRDLSKIKDRYFDYVISMGSSIGCIPKRKNRQMAMKELARVLKPGGILAIHAHNFIHESPIDTLLILKTYIRHDPDLEAGDEIYFHGKELGHTFLHYFTETELDKMFRQANLRVLRKAYLNQDQGNYYTGMFKSLLSGGFIFVGKK